MALGKVHHSYCLWIGVDNLVCENFINLLYLFFKFNLRKLSCNVQRLVFGAGITALGVLPIALAVRNGKAFAVVATFSVGIIFVFALNLLSWGLSPRPNAGGFDTIRDHMFSTVVNGSAFH